MNERDAILEALARLRISVGDTRRILATDDGKAALFLAIAPRHIDNPEGITANECAEVLGWLDATLLLVQMALHGRMYLKSIDNDEPEFALRVGEDASADCGRGGDELCNR